MDATARLKKMFIFYLITGKKRFDTIQPNIIGDEK